MQSNESLRRLGMSVRTFPGRRPGAWLALALALTFTFTRVTDAAWAHHSSSNVDMTRRVTLTGMLTRFDWRNPHIEFFVETKGANGQMETWSFESGSPSALVLRKISKAMFVKAIGQTVTVEVSTARDGSRAGICWKITFPDKTIAVMRE